jgi:hypothetical protein
MLDLYSLFAFIINTTLCFGHYGNKIPILQYGPVLADIHIVIVREGMTGGQRRGAS